jgi:hypothetical protein
MPRPALSACGNGAQQVIRTRNAMTLERAYTTPRKIIDVNKKIRNTNRLMDEAFKSRDIKTYCELTKVWVAAMDMWMRIVAFPKPSTVKPGENPISHMFPTGGSKYFGDAALVDVNESSDSETIPA